MVTINDLANESGVSVGSISRYLNGARLKPANMEAIDRAIKKTGYHSNYLARSMKTGKSMIVAIVVPGLANMFSMRIIESMERVLEKEGYSVIVADCNQNAENEYQKLELLRNRMIDGCILMPVGQDAGKIKQLMGTIPVVLIDRTMDSNPFDSVTIDNRKASYQLMKRAIEAGAKKIGILSGPQDVSTARERTAGCLDAMKEFGIISFTDHKCGYNVEDGYRAMQECFTENLDLVFASNYELTVGAMNAIYESGKKLKVIGFDSIELAYFTNQAYDYISQPVEEIGKQAAGLLLQRMKDPSREINNIKLEAGM